MAARQKRWAKKSRLKLIDTLTKGLNQCQDPECSGVSDRLEIHHPNGRAYDIEKLAPDQVITIYWREYRSGVPLGVLCCKCNKAKRNQPHTEEQYEEPAF